MWSSAINTIKSYWTGKTPGVEEKPLTPLEVNTGAAALPRLQQDETLPEIAFIDWRSTILNAPDDANSVEKTKRLAQSLRSCTDGSEREVAKEICTLLDRDKDLCFRLGNWMYKDAGVHGKDRNDAAWMAVRDLMQVVATKMPRSDGQDEMDIFIRNVLKTDDFSKPFLHNSILMADNRGYELEKGGKLYQFKQGSSSLQEAPPDQFRNCSRPSRPHIFKLGNTPGKIFIRIVCPADCKQVDLIINEHYLFIYAPGGLTDKPKEALVKVYWEGLFSDKDRPSLTEFQELIKQAEVINQAGVLGLTIHTGNSA